MSGRDRVSEPKSKEKPFVISKRLVWDAFQRVKVNKGAPGVDGCSIEEFEEDLGDNLYQVWNRMSSGSYFPPPVRAVSIPKPGGRGERILGVPTVADRVAQTAVAMVLEPRVEGLFHPRLLRLPAGTCPDRRGDGVPEALLEEQLGAGLGHPELLRQRSARPDRQGCGSEHRPAVGGAVCEAVADCAA
jgi:hypothetical protein